MAEWIAPEEAPNHTWGWVLWGSCCGGRKVALGARDGGVWRADGYARWGLGDWVPLQWCALEPPEPPNM